MPTPALRLHTQDLRPQPAPAAEPSRAGADFANLLALQLQAPAEPARGLERRAEPARQAAVRLEEQRAERAVDRAADRMTDRMAARASERRNERANEATATRPQEPARARDDSAQPDETQAHAERRTDSARAGDPAAANRKVKAGARNAAAEAKPATAASPATASAGPAEPVADELTTDAPSAEGGPPAAAEAAVQEAIAALLGVPVQASPVPADGAATQPAVATQAAPVAQSLAEAVAPQAPAPLSEGAEATRAVKATTGGSSHPGELQLAGAPAPAADPHLAATELATTALRPDKTGPGARPGEQGSDPALAEATANTTAPELGNAAQPPALAAPETPAPPQDAAAPTVPTVSLAPEASAAQAAALQAPAAAEPLPKAAEPGLNLLAPLPGSAPAGSQPAAAALASPVGSAYLRHAPGQAGFAQELGAQVAVWVREGVQQAQLNLNPAELGPVQVRILLDGQQAQVQFLVEHSQTREALQAGVAELDQALKSEGLSLGRADVHTGNGRESAQSAAAQSQQGRDDGRADGRGDGRGDGRPRPGSPWPGDPGQAGAPQTRGHAPRGLLDLYA